MSNTTPGPSHVQPPTTHFCKPCKKDISIANLESHLAGKKHWMRCAVMADRLPPPDLPASTSADMNTSYYCDDCSKSVKTLFRQQHLCGSTAVAEQRSTSPGEGLNQKLPKTGAGVGCRKNNMHEGGGRRKEEAATTGGTIIAGGACMACNGNEKQKAVEEAEDEVIAIPGHLHTGENGFSLEGGKYVCLLDPAAPICAFTLQSQSSTDRLYCEICVRQFDTISGFRMHMKDKLHRRTLEFKITSAPNMRIPGIAAYSDLSLEPACKEPVDQIPYLPASQDNPAVQGSFARYSAKTSMNTQLNAPPGLGETNASGGREHLQTPTIPDRITAQWYCSACAIYMNITSFDQHLESPLHLGQVLFYAAMPESDTGPEVIQTHPPGHEQVPPSIPVDSFFCAICRMTRRLVDYGTHLNSKKHLNKARLQPDFAQGVQSFWFSPIGSEETLEDMNSHQSGVQDFDGENGEAAGDFDGYNELAFLGLEDNDHEQRITAETQSEIWNCTICEIMMPPAIRKEHEANPTHVCKLEQNKLNESGQTHTPEPSSEPADSQAELFRCLVCLTTYGSIDRALHYVAPWYCEPCDVIIHKSDKHSHLDTISHRINECIPKDEAADSAFIPASKNTFFCIPCHGNFLKSDREFHISSPYYCVLCALLMHRDSRDIHEWSLQHDQHIAAATGGLVKKHEMFNCQTCKSDFPVAVQPFHKSRAWTCRICDVTVHMDWIGAHLASSEHVVMESNQGT